MKRRTVLTMLTVLFGLGTIAVFGLAPSEALGAVPQLINFQGVVKDSAGNTPAVDMLSLTFTIYDAPLGGAALWTESQSVTIVAGGLFSVLLGANSPIPDSVFADSSRWLGIQVETDPEMLPRQRLVAVGYAYRVGTVDGATGGIISGDVSIQSNLSVDGAMNAKNMVLAGPGPVNTPLLIQGSPGQTANLMEIKDNSGVTFAVIGPNGDADLYGKFGVNGPVVVQADAGQTANLMEIKNSDGAPLVSVGPGGGVHFTGASGVTLTVEGAPAPGANLQEWRVPLPGGGMRMSAMDELGQSGIGTGTPHSTLHVNGSFALALNTFSCGTITLNSSHSVVLFEGAEAETCIVFLPSAVGISGRQYTVKVKNAPLNPVVRIMVSVAGQTIDGNFQYWLNAPNQFATIVSDGANWWIIAKN